MTLSIENKTILPQRINPVHSNSDSNAPQSASAVPDNFSNLLRNYLNNPQILPPAEMINLPLNKSQINILQKIVQTKMNHLLFQSFFQNQGEINILSSNFKQGIPLVKDEILTKASNNSQVTPNNNVSDEKNRFTALINKAAKKYGIDADLISSLIKAESNYNPRATSPVGAMGLMQLMPQTAKDLGVQNAYDPEENIMGGTRYLKMLLERYNNDLNLALAAYNWGMGNLERKPDNLPLETSKYISRVNTYYNEFKKSV